MTSRFGIIRGTTVAQVDSVDALEAVERLFGHPLMWVPAELPPPPPPRVVAVSLADIARMLGGPVLPAPQTSAPVHREPTLGFTDLCTHCGCWHVNGAKCCTCGNERGMA